MKRFLQSLFTVVLVITVGACSQPSASTQTDTSTPEPTVETTLEPTKAPTPEPTSETTPTPTAEPTKEPTPEPTPEPVIFTVEGDYKMFGVRNEGSFVKSSDLEMESDIVLKDGGTGTMYFDGENMDITKWELKDGKVSITLADGGVADALAHDGILELDIYGDDSMVMYFAQDGADISGYEF